MDEFFASIGYANALIVLGVLIFVHELGHYLVARWCGVRVEVFSIGFGRELLGRTDRRGTRWKLSLFPFGGYVKMFGDGFDPSAASGKGAFAAASLPRRAAIVAAGPAANFLFAIVALAALALAYGRAALTETVEASIGAVTPDSAAAAAGLLPGDRILRIDGREITGFSELAERVGNGGGRPMTLQLARDGALRSVSVTPRAVALPDGQTAFRLGVAAPPPQRRAVGPTEALWVGVVDSWTLTVLTLQGVGRLFVGDGLDQVGGPVRIAQLSADVGNLGPAALLRFMALLSINLGLLNLFPIPVLDGGHLLFFAAEAVLRRPLNARLRMVATQAGMLLLLGLMVLLTFNDLS